MRNPGSKIQNKKFRRILRMPSVKYILRTKSTRIRTEIKKDCEMKKYENGFQKKNTEDGVQKFS